MTHLFVFNENSRAAVYGIGTYIGQLAECFQDRKDILLNIVQLHAEEKEFKVEDTKGFRTFFFPSVSFIYFQKSPAYYRNIWSLLRSYIHPEKTDQLIFHLNYFQEEPLIALFRRDYPLCKIIFSIHYQNWCFTLKGNTSYFKQIIHSRKDLLTEKKEKKVYESYEEEKKVLEAVDRVICLAEYTRNLLLDTYLIPEEKIVVVPNGMKDKGRIVSQKEVIEIRKKYFFSEKGKIILFVGRLDEIKGVDVLIRAFIQILAEYPDARLLVVGDGLFSTYLKESKGFWSKIVFTGRLEKEELFRLYQIADIGVMPSTHEQCSYVAIEMMMFGLPLVISTSTGLSEMLNGEDELYKVNIREEVGSTFISETELKDKIIKVFSDKKYKQRIRSRYEKQYKIENMRTGYISVYKQLFDKISLADESVNN